LENGRDESELLKAESELLEAKSEPLKAESELLKASDSSIVVTKKSLGEDGLRTSSKGEVTATCHVGKQQRTLRKTERERPQTMWGKFVVNKQ
jgi:hypothetical protein